MRGGRGLGQTVCNRYDRRGKEKKKWRPCAGEGRFSDDKKKLIRL